MKANEQSGLSHGGSITAVVNVKGGARICAPFGRFANRSYICRPFKPGHMFVFTKPRGYAIPSVHKELPVIFIYTFPAKLEELPNVIVTKPRCFWYDKIILEKVT